MNRKPVGIGYRVSAVAGALLVALSAAACQGVAGTPASGGDDDGPVANTVTDDGNLQVSPLAEYLSLVWGTDLSPDERAQRDYDLNRRQQELIAQCMQEAGFEFYPELGEASVNPIRTDWRPDDREWVAQWGYGLTRNPEAEMPAPPVQEGTNPNYEYFSSLSEAEAQAYNEALYGAPIDDENHVWTWEEMGCWGFAQNETATASPIDLVASQEFAPLFEALNQLESDVTLADQRAAIEREWAVCMADAGYPGLESRWDAQDQFSTEVDEFLKDWWEQYGEDPTGTPEMTELGRREVELALADLDCRESVNYQTRLNSAQYELEARFVEEHRADLEALRAAAEQMSS